MGMRPCTVSKAARRWNVFINCLLIYICTDLVYEDRGEGAMDAIHCDANADAGCGR